MPRSFNTLRFEATPDGGVNAGLTPEGLLTEEERQPAEPEQSWGGITQEEWQQQQELIAQQQEMLQQLAPVAEYMQEAPGPAQHGQETPRLPDPFSDNYQQEMEQYLEWRDSQKLAPYQEIMQEQRREALWEQARDMVSDVVQREGELLNPAYDEGIDGMTPEDRIVSRAVDYTPEMEQKFGPGLRAEEEAIMLAYQEEKQYQQALIAANEQRAQNQINALRQAPREPGTTGIAAQPAVTTQAGGWDAFKERHGLY